MSVYRVHSKGAWSGGDKVRKLERSIEGYSRVDAYTSHIYNAEFDVRRKTSRDVLRRLKGEPEDRPWVFRFCKTVWRFTPPIFIWILKALVPKVIMDKLYSRMTG
jgi:hypothetical protein